MKISELTPIASPRRNIILPLAVVDDNGKALGNGNVSLGQILDSVPKSIVPFQMVTTTPANAVIAETEGPPLLGKVIFDIGQNRFFYAVVTLGSIGEGYATTTYYTLWNGSDDFIAKSGSIRKDCLFRAENGQLYFYDGETLKSAGGPRTEVISTEEYEALDSPDPDTIYYIYED